MDWLLFLVTIAVGPLMLIGAVYAVITAGRRFKSSPTKVGIWFGGGLGIAAMAVFGVLEAATTGAHPVTLLLMLFVGLYGIVGGMALGGLAGALTTRTVAFLAKR